MPLSIFHSNVKKTNIMNEHKKKQVSVKSPILNFAKKCILKISTVNDNIPENRKDYKSLLAIENIQTYLTSTKAYLL